MDCPECGATTGASTRTTTGASTRTAAGATTRIGIRPGTGIHARTGARASPTAFSGAPGIPGPSADVSHTRRRVRVLATTAVLALVCVGATVAAVAGSGGGNGGNDVEDTGIVAVPTGFGPPQLPGLAGGETDSGTESGTGTDSGTESGTGTESEAGGDVPSPDDGVTSMATGSGPDAGYTAWAGPGCASGEYREHGRFENGDAAWYTVTSGGHRGDSCDGRFSAVPMSGSPDQDRGSTAVWSWQLGKGYARCALAVYVPDSGQDRDTAGHPTVYRVLTDPSDITSAYAAFGVRQTAHRGGLVSVGSYRVEGESFSVQLLDRGRDWGSPDRYGAHHAAAQMKVDCA
ncbi:adhesin [Streptomyces sp. NPDC056909]|uniref:adhesin n=1 Tax=Streptomyces sp. NPDC056909 TaxID=3345963 RepID=UPI0036CEC142